LAPDVDALGVFPPSDAAVDWSSGIRAAWDISEAGAEEAWAHFKRLNLARYEEDASLTDDDATAVSRLSPYLRFGQISPRRLYREMSVAEKKTKTKDGVFDSIRSAWAPAEPHVLAQAVPPRVRVLAAHALADSGDALGARALRATSGLALGVDRGGRSVWRDRSRIGISGYEKERVDGLDRIRRKRRRRVRYKVRFV
jgi:deoxyribodipyrimidine photo-lyase